MMGILTLATILLFTFMRTGMTLGRKEAVALLVFYAVFVGWMILETFGVTSLLL
jgi:cation:H+ antiporter